MMLKKGAINKQNDRVHIGILEVRRHPAVLHSFCSICNTMNTRVTVFTIPRIFNRLQTLMKDPSQFHFIVKKKNQRLLSFLRQIKKYSEQHLDLLFVNTIHETWYDLFHFSKFNPDVLKILTIHHVNAWLDPTDHLNEMNSLQKINVHMMKSSMQTILSYYDGLNVIYSPLKHYVEDTLKYQGPVFVIPSAVSEQDDGKPRNQKTKQKLVITIPGLIQAHRKNFTQARSVFNSLPRTYLKNIELILLGAAFDKTGKTIIKTFKSLREKGLTVKTFDHFIDDDTFYHYIRQSDILFLPIKIHTKADNGVNEIYGKTVGSGVVYDAIKYAKPVIIPAQFQMISSFKDATMSYQSEEKLRNLLMSCIDNPEILNKKKQQAIIASNHFSLQHYQEYFNNSILHWLENNKQY